MFLRGGDGRRLVACGIMFKCADRTLKPNYFGNHTLCAYERHLVLDSQSCPPPLVSYMGLDGSETRRDTSSITSILKAVMPSTASWSSCYVYTFHKACTRRSPFLFAALLLSIVPLHHLQSTPQPSSRMLGTCVAYGKTMCSCVFASSDEHRSRPDRATSAITVIN
jgi:hypothetical protein